MFHHNLESGLHVYDCAVTNIHGDESRANNNSKYGLLAWNSGQIHLHVYKHIYIHLHIHLYK